MSYQPPYPPQQPPHGPQRGNQHPNYQVSPSPKNGLALNPKTLSIIAVCIVAVVVLIIGTAILSSSKDETPPSTAAAASGDSESITGSLREWQEAVCYLGSLRQGGGGFPSATGRDRCQADGDLSTVIFFGKFDSDYLMRNDLALMQIRFYTSAISSDQSVVAIAITGTSSKALNPLREFGFEIVSR